MNPKNEFANLFGDGGEKVAEKFKPAEPPEQTINALIQLVSHHPEFYKDAKLRLLVCNGIVRVTDYMLSEIEAGRKPEMHIGTAAFMMMLGERMTDSHDQYASDEEKKRFPLNPNED